MNRASLAAALAVALLLGSVSPGIAADEARAEEERLLGSDGDDVRLERLPAVHPTDRRDRNRRRIVRGLDRGGRRAGGGDARGAGRPSAPRSTLARDLRDGDRFYVRYEQTFTAAGAPLDVGRVLWAELRTAAKGTVAIHRFRTRDGAERFWLVNGQAATPPSIRLPVDVVSVSSGFGLRADPFDQPPPPPTAGKSGAMGGPLRQPPALPPGLKAGTIPGETPLASSAGLSSYGGFRAGAACRAPGTRALFMHEGVDLVAPAGTPVHAAADGVVVGAGPNGRYGNWIRIEHAGKLATVYGHLSRIRTGHRGRRHGGRAAS